MTDKSLQTLIYRLARAAISQDCDSAELKRRSDGALALILYRQNKIVVYRYSLKGGAK